MKHPSAHAKELADAILNDPIAAGQIKECIPNDQLVELLVINLPPYPEPPESDIDDFSDRELKNEVGYRDLMPDLLKRELTSNLIDELMDRGVSLPTIQDFYSK